MLPVTINDNEFEKFRKLIYELAGIVMTPAKKSLIVSRLSKRLRHFNLGSFGEYYRLVSDPENKGELQMMVDLLTTNETYFFRESKHFDTVARYAIEQKSWNIPFRIWSAASSTGEEAYSISMVLHDAIGDSAWEIVGTDISTRVLERARRGLYSMERTEHMPKEFLLKYCLKGVRAHDGTILIRPELRKKVSFRQLNLLGPWGDMGMYNVIFLRNVMIYFDTETKQRLVARMANHLKPGGYFLIGHSESLNGIYDGLKTISPSVYQKV